MSTTSDDFPEPDTPHTPRARRAGWRRRHRGGCSRGRRDVHPPGRRPERPAPVARCATVEQRTGDRLVAGDVDDPAAVLAGARTDFDDVVAARMSTGSCSTAMTVFPASRSSARVSVSAATSRGGARATARPGARSCRAARRRAPRPASHAGPRRPRGSSWRGRGGGTRARPAGGSAAGAGWSRAHRRRPDRTVPARRGKASSSATNGMEKKLGAVVPAEVDGEVLGPEPPSVALSARPAFRIHAADVVEGQPVEAPPHPALVGLAERDVELVDERPVVERLRVAPDEGLAYRLGHLGPRGGVGPKPCRSANASRPQVQAGAGGAHVALRVVAGRVEAPAAHRLFGPADELRFDEGALEAAPEAAAAERQG